MVHAIELVALLLLMTIGHSVLDVAPHALRRIVRSYAAWLVAFGAGVVVFAFPPVAAWAVRLGIVVIGAYLLRWLVRGALDHFGGPQLLAAPGTGALAGAAEKVAQLPAGPCRKAARRIARRHDGFVALLGLVSTGVVEADDEEEFGRRWSAACEEARAMVVELAERFGPKGGRVRTADARFLAQMLLLYDQKSVERTLSRRASPALGSRARRLAAAAQLEETGQRRAEAEMLGLVQSPAEKKARAVEEAGGVTLLGLLWPASGLRRAGFRRRALALGFSHGLLFGYAALALLVGRSSGWIYLAVGGLIHVEGVFALGDFVPTRVHESGGAVAGGEAQ